MVMVWLEQAGSRWYGVASHGESLVATVASRDRVEAERQLVGGIPQGVEWKLDDMGSGFARGVVAMLDRLEQGDETGKRFSLSDVYLPQGLRAVLLTAAAIPLGYVTTYGDIAAAAGSNARSVGRTMATNPLYPIVPCHRVLGVDLALTGYGGSRGRPALEAKLNRLRAETRGHDAQRALEAAGGLVVYPVEWAIRKAERDGMDGLQQMELF